MKIDSIEILVNGEACVLMSAQLNDYVSRVIEADDNDFKTPGAVLATMLNAGIAERIEGDTLPPMIIIPKGPEGLTQTVEFRDGGLMVVMQGTREIIHVEGHKIGFPEEGETTG